MRLLGFGRLHRILLQLLRDKVPDVRLDSHAAHLETFQNVRDRKHAVGNQDRTLVLSWIGLPIIDPVVPVASVLGPRERALVTSAVVAKLKSIWRPLLAEPDDHVEVLIGEPPALRVILSGRGHLLQHTT